MTIVRTACGEKRYVTSRRYRFAVVAYLIRHAHAGSRSHWPGDDSDRPLSEKGEKQAVHLVDLMGNRAIRAIYSSPSTRCTQTVEPLARTLDLPIQIASQLAEGASADRAIEFILARAHENPALCSHGDLIPKVIRRLKSAGMYASHANISQKGSVWILETDGGRITEGRYHPPGPAPDDA